MTSARAYDFSLQVFTWLLLPVALALGMGIFAAMDPVWGSQYPVRQFEINRHLPYLWSLVLVLVLLAVAGMVRARHFVFERRYEALIATAIVAGGFSGLNVGMLDPTDLAFLVLLAGCACLVLIERHPFPSDGVLLVILFGLVVCSLASIINGLLISLISLRQLYTKMFMLYVLALLIWRVGLLRFSLKTWVWVALFSALVALATEVAFVGFGYVFTLDDSTHFMYKDTPLGRMLRATAFLPRTQTLAHLLLLAFSVLLFIKVRWPWRLLGLGLIGAGVVSTFSTGGWIVLAVIFVLSFFLRNPEYTIHYLVLLLVIGLTVYLTGAAEWVYTEVIQQMGGKQAEDRIYLTQIGLKTIAEHPLIGVGFKNIARVLYTPVHNAYLQTAAEMGILAGVLFTSLILYLTVRSGLLIRRLSTGEDKNCVKGLFLGMIAIAGHLLVEPFYENYISWVFMGMVAASLFVFDSDTVRQAAPGSRLGLWDGRARTRAANGDALQNDLYFNPN